MSLKIVDVDLLRILICFHMLNMVFFLPTCRIVLGMFCRSFFFLFPVKHGIIYCFPHIPNQILHTPPINATLPLTEQSGYLLSISAAAM